MPSRGKAGRPLYLIHIIMLAGQAKFFGAESDEACCYGPIVNFTLQVGCIGLYPAP